MRRTEELADHRSNRLGVDQILRLNIVQNFRTHSFADGSFHTQQAHAVLVFHQFADRADAAVAQVVDIVDFAVAVTQFDQTFDNAQDIVFAQRAISIRCFFKRNVQRGVHLYAADRRQVIALVVEEQRFEQGVGSFVCRRFARTHNAIDVKQGIFPAVVLVHFQSVADIRPDIDVVDIKNLDFVDFGFFDLVQQLLVDLGAGIGDDFAGLFLDQSSSQEFSEQLVFGHAVEFQSFVNQLLGGAGRDLLAGFPNRFSAFGINQVKSKLNPAETFGHEFALPAFFVGNIGINIVKIAEDFFLVHSFDFGTVDLLSFFCQLFQFFFGFLGIKGIKDRSNRQFAAAVNTGIKQIFGIKFKIQPRTAVRNNPGSKQIFAGSNSFAFVVVKENARRTVHLRNDDTLGTVDDKGTFVRHQRNIAHINVLFLDVVDRTGTGGLVNIPDNQTQRGFDRRGIGHVAFDAFVNVILRLFEFIFDKLKFAGSGKVFNGENGFENFFQTEFAIFVFDEIAV